MASPGKRRRKKMNGGYGILDTPEVIEEAPKAAPIETDPVVTPKPKKKRKSFFDKD
jgi:hypothetical protein